jgi:hypothetical protein
MTCKQYIFISHSSGGWEVQKSTGRLGSASWPHMTDVTRDLSEFSYIWLLISHEGSTLMTKSPHKDPTP